MKLHYYGHSCFGVECGGKHLLFDPFITGNEQAKEIDINTIPADFILISHGHTDHILDAEAIAKRTGAMVICSWEIYEWLSKKGVSNIHPMNTGGKRNFDFGIVQCVTAQHSSGLPDGSYGGNPMGFVVSSSDGAFYFSGDTSLTWDMKLIPMLSPALDFCIFPLGDNFTMGYEQAVLAAQFVECKTVVGCHYDTFGYIVIDKTTVRNAFEEADLTLLLPEINSSFTV